MIIVFGYRRNNTAREQIQYTCSRCRQQAYHTIVRSHRWFTLFFIPVIPLGETTISSCNRCGYQTLIDNAQADAWFREAPTSIPSASQREVDLRYDVTISFEEAVFGCQKEIELSRWETCPTCRGNGVQPGASTSSCKQCAGQGRVHTNRRVVVNIPAGVDDGINVRVTNEGEVSARGGTPGNLYVVLTVKPHPVFKRQGNDIIRSMARLPCSRFPRARKATALSVSWAWEFQVYRVIFVVISMSLLK
jgi:hypothetical protein